MPFSFGLPLLQPPAAAPLSALGASFAATSLAPPTSGSPLLQRVYFALRFFVFPRVITEAARVAYSSVAGAATAVLADGTLASTAGNGRELVNAMLGTQGGAAVLTGEGGAVEACPVAAQLVTERTSVSRTYLRLLFTPPPFLL